MHKKFAERIADVYKHRVKHLGDAAAKKWVAAHLKNNQDHVQMIANAIKERTSVRKKP